MKLQHLRFFVAAVDSGGIVRASERLSVSQPAVTAGLKALERELGQPLFEPTGRGRRVRPTPKAMEFYNDAQEILRKCEIARNKFGSKVVQWPKRRIGLLQTIAARHVTCFTQALANGSPELHLQLREGSRTKMREWLRSGRLMSPGLLWKEPGATHANSGRSRSFCSPAGRIDLRGNGRPRFPGGIRRVSI